MAEAREHLKSNEFRPGERYRYTCTDGKYQSDPLILELFVREEAWTMEVTRGSGERDTTGFTKEIRSVTAEGAIAKANKAFAPRGVVLPTDFRDWEAVRKKDAVPRMSISSPEPGAMPENVSRHVKDQFGRWQRSS